MDNPVVGKLCWLVETKLKKTNLPIPVERDLTQPRFRTTGSEYNNELLFPWKEPFLVVAVHELNFMTEYEILWKDKLGTIWLYRENPGCKVELFSGKL